MIYTDLAQFLVYYLDIPKITYKVLAPCCDWSIREARIQAKNALVNNKAVSLSDSDINILHCHVILL